MNTQHSSQTQRARDLWSLLTRALDALQPLAALLARLYVAQVFFLSGLTKLRDWETTVALFTDEYKVPLLSPPLAAALGTLGELALPVLLVIGLGGPVFSAGSVCRQRRCRHFAQRNRTGGAAAACVLGLASGRVGHLRPGALVAGPVGGPGR